MGADDVRAVFTGLVRVFKYAGFAVGKVLPERQIRVLGPQERGDGEGRQEGDNLFHILVSYRYTNIGNNN